MRTIRVEGEIGKDVTPEWFRGELRKADGQDIRLEISSPGGSVFKGKTMVHAIRNYSGRVEAVITGIAASMAAAIACAADHLTVDDQSVLMLHKASGGVYGNADDMGREREVLEALDRQYAEIFASKSGHPVDFILEKMRDEWWLYGGEISDEGFADEFVDAGRVYDKAAAIADGRARFAACYRPPSGQEIAAMADTRVPARDDDTALMAARARSEGRTLPEVREDVEAAKIAGMSYSEFKRWG